MSEVQSNKNAEYIFLVTPVNSEWKIILNLEVTSKVNFFNLTLCFLRLFGLKSITKVYYHPILLRVVEACWKRKYYNTFDYYVKLINYESKILTNAYKWPSTIYRCFIRKVIRLQKPFLPSNRSTHRVLSY